MHRDGTHSREAPDIHSCPRTRRITSAVPALGSRIPRAARIEFGERNSGRHLRVTPLFNNQSWKSFAMRPLRKERIAAPAPREKAGTGLPTSGYALVVDGQAKASFTAMDPALKAAKDLKGRFPVLQIKIYDAEKKQAEQVELAAA